MKKKYWIRTIEAGKGSVIENEIFQLVITITAMVIDFVITYSSFESTLNQSILLNIAGCIGVCLVIDLPPLLLSKVIMSKELDNKKKIAFSAILGICVAVAFLLLFSVRWSTRLDLSSGDLGLMGDATSSFAGLDQTAIFIGFTPLFTSVVIFFTGIITYEEPDEKRIRALIIQYVESKQRENILLARIKEFGTEEERQGRMKKYVTGISYLTKLKTVIFGIKHKALSRKTLAEVIEADGREITMIMEENENRGKKNEK